MLHCRRTKKPLAVELDEKFYSGLAPYTTYIPRTVFIHGLAFNGRIYLTSEEFHSGSAATGEPLEPNARRTPLCFD
jgi:hypothetical protein